MSTDPTNTTKTRRCQHLRSKEMFYDTGEPEHSGSGIYWCNNTLQVLGPDGKPVDDEDCGPERSCYEQ